MSRTITLVHKLSPNDQNLYKDFKKNRNYDLFFNLSEELQKKLYNNFNIDFKTNDVLILDTYKKMTANICSELYLTGKSKLDRFYDISLPVNTNLAHFMIVKIKKFLYKEMNTNSKNILLGDTKEKWGSIVGHIETNRRDKAIRIINYVKQIRKKYPFISSSFTIKTINFELEPYKLKGLNNYVNSYKYSWEKKKRRNITNKVIRTKYFRYSSIPSIENYKKTVISNRKKTIKYKYRYIWRDNFK